MSKIDIKPIVKQWIDNNLPTQYGEGYSWYETILVLTRKVDEVISQVNNYFDKDLVAVVSDTLTEWKNSGQLEIIISELLQTQIDDVEASVQGINNNLTSINADVAENNIEIANIKDVVISISDYPRLETETTDTERLQRAIDLLRDQSGGKLLLGNEVYEINDSLILYPFINIVGQSISSTLLKITVDKPLFKPYEKVNRIDGIKLKDFRIIRNSLLATTPLIDMEYISYSTLENISATQDNSQENSDGNIGVLFGNFSYYNNVNFCQFRYFHTGIKFHNEANGNIVIGGSCISCGVYGVHIVKSNSTRFYGHSVELLADVAYKLEDRSLFNNFFGCRIEGTTDGYQMFYQPDNLSNHSNTVFGGLGYVAGTMFNSTASNFKLDHIGIPEIADWANKAAFKMASNATQSSIPSGTDTEILMKTVWYDRANNVIDNDTFTNKVFKANKTGLYNFDVQIGTSSTQTWVEIMMFVNGSRVFAKYANKNSRSDEWSTHFSQYLQNNDVVNFYVKLQASGNIVSGGNTTYITGWLC